jgi:hypothetical protein
LRAANEENVAAAMIPAESEIDRGKGREKVLRLADVLQFRVVADSRVFGP